MFYKATYTDIHLYNLRNCPCKDQAIPMMMAHEKKIPTVYCL